MLFRDFELISGLRVAETNPPLLESTNDFLQIGIKLGFDLVDLIVCDVETIINANLWLRNLCS